MKKAYLLSFLILIFCSCQKYERNNPFDPNCPKEMWTPTDFKAVQNGTSVTLTWSQPTNNISGFKLTKKVDTGAASDMTPLSKGITTLADPTLAGGKLHTYTLIAYAGSNQSNVVSTTVTPILAAGGIITTAASSITAISATSGATISTDGGSTLAARGVCWANTTGPTITGNKTVDGTGTGTFTSNISGLAANSPYYVRAYATNSVGTTYGNEVSFRTLSGVSTITTTNATSITASTASSGGNITTDGGAAITARGVCWATTSNPTIAGSKTADGAGIGIFTSSLVGLTPNMTYFVRTYAINSTGTTYGNEVTFKTLTGISILTTIGITNITSFTASSGGTITDDGGSTVTARGICWGTTTNPAITGSKTVDGTGTGSFTSSISGLLPGTTYYIRAYATNSAGTAYGSEVSFKTASVATGSVTDVDGNAYSTITIGNQIWMASNLRTTKYNDGTSIPLVTDNTTWGNLLTPGYCWYDNDATTYKGTYGGLYNWYTVDTGKLCPTDWHVPSSAEWTILTTYLGGESIAGGKLKEAGTIHWLSPNEGATNEMGFSSLPGGNRNSDGTFNNIGRLGNWWSSTEILSTGASSRRMNWSIGNALNQNFNKLGGFSIRCLRD